MKKLFQLLILFLSFNCYAQIVFEEGYYISEAGERVDCLIKNVDWASNPTGFEYKLTENSDVKTATIKTIKEFGIGTEVKYVKFDVAIDRSSTNLNNLSRTPLPEFNDEQLLLKVLVEGNASLYYYKDNSYSLFFFKTETIPIEQLIYKNWINPNNTIGTYNKFREQLWASLQCNNISYDKVRTIDYKKKDLANLFVRHNECINSDYINYQKQHNKGAFNITLRPGITSSQYSILMSPSNLFKTDFNRETGFRFGVELEYILPFNKNKWAVTLEPNYQYYKTEKTIIVQFTSDLSTQFQTEVDYKSIEIPLGVRYYAFLNEKSKLFINGNYVLDLAQSSTITSNRPEILNFKLSSETSLAAGIGFNYDDTVSIELRYGFGRELLNDLLFWSSSYESFSLILGYTIL